jgi:hypothetical protein
MKMITSRQSRLLKFLLSRKGYTTLLKIAEYLKVSEKTIQRDLRLLEEWLMELNIIVDKRAGTGVKLSAGNITTLLHLDQLMGTESDDTDGIMSNSRRVKIASQLLSETPHETSISKLSERYFISSASIVNDLKVIESWIAPLGLFLRAFPDWTIVGVVSAGSLPSALAENIELVVSTINLPAIAIPAVYVSAFFNDADLKRVTEMLIAEKLYRTTFLLAEN